MNNGTGITLWADTGPLTDTFVYANTLHASYKSVYLDEYSDAPSVVFQNNLIEGGSIYYKGASGGAAVVQATYGEEWVGNIDAAPLYVSPPEDLHAASGSASVDAGRSLTFATEGGTQSTQLPVERAGFFTDGWGLIAGDEIQLEGVGRAVVVQADYQGNVLTLDRPLTWARGAGVNLPYDGGAPDQGAFER